MVNRFHEAHGNFGYGTRNAGKKILRYREGFRSRMYLIGRDNKDSIKDLFLENREVIEGVTVLLFGRCTE